jgi:hypothetical protein
MNVFEMRPHIWHVDFEQYQASPQSCKQRQDAEHSNAETHA